MTRTEIEAVKEADLWADIPDFPRHAWQDEAGAGDTQLGYWDWVETQLSVREAEVDSAVGSLSGDDITAYLEFARRAMVPPACYAFAAAMDISDEELDRLRDQLQTHMGRVPEERNE